MSLSSAARLLFSVLFCTACVTTPSGKVVRANALWTVVESFYDEHLALNPLEATYLGDHRFDAQLGNPASPAYDAATKALDERALQAAQAIDPATLDEADQLTREIFIRERQLSLQGARFPTRLLALNQMDNMVTTLARLGSGDGPQPFDTLAQHEVWLQRAAQFSPWVDAAIAAMREGQARGVTQPRITMEKVLSQLDGLAFPKLEGSLFAQPLEKLTGSDRERLTAQYRQVFDGQVLPAMARLRDFIKNEHLAKCRTTVGWSALPDGAAWYAWLVEQSTTTPMGVNDIHALGLNEVARIRNEMQEVQRQVGFQGTLAQFFAHVRDDKALYFEKPEQVLEGYRALKKRIDGLLPTLFSDFPKADYEVRAIEAYRAASSAGAEYQPPAADGSRPGIFYVNTYNLKAQPRYGIETLSLHEAAPGHHFQVAIAQELEGLPRFRRFAGYVAYVEGWALYSESLGKELGLFTDAMQYYGRLNDEQLRAMRLAVDTGLHAKGWTREQAIQFMTENSSLAETDVVAEVERYMVWPAQALGYKVGQLELTGLRKKAEQALGEKFDVKAWHSAVLRGGAMPLDVLAKKLDRWVGAQAKAHAVAPPMPVAQAVAQQQPAPSLEAPEEDDVNSEETGGDELGESDAQVTSGERVVTYTKDLSDQALGQSWQEHPETLGCISVGFVEQGRLINGKKFPPGAGWTVVSPAQSYGTDETISYLIAAIENVRAQYPNAPPLRVNALSASEGGYLRPHKTHQSGRDVDLGFYYPTANVVMAREREKYIDVALNWALLKSLVTVADVQVIFLDRRVQKVLYEHALKNGEDPTWLASLFHAGKASIVQHAPRHRDHFHVRFYNPRAQELGWRVAPLLAKRPDQNIAMHRVRPGDTLGHLAQRYNSSVSLIQKANRMNGSFLRLAQVLKIPLRGPCTQCPVPAPVIVPGRRLPPPQGSIDGPSVGAP
ncbi:MAG: penicillin-insensitive murein endopeptidase [Myxococcaceae bacterium]|nr:penicillin-insensitive murein endopeptidase [Myxococcaceae bacterium]